MRALLAVLLLVGVGLTGTVPALAESRPRESAQFLEDFANRAIEQLTDAEASDDAKARRFRDLLNEGFDVSAISGFIIGRYWRGASQELKQDFTTVFQDYLVQRFLPLFAEYKGETFATEKTTPDTNDPSVNWVTIRIDLPDSEPVRTEWRVRERDEVFKILDVKAEGISMAITLRDEFNSVMRNKGGLAGLIREMRALVEKGAYRPS